MAASLCVCSGYGYENECDLKSLHHLDHESESSCVRLPPPRQLPPPTDRISRAAHAGRIEHPPPLGCSSRRPCLAVDRLPNAPIAFSSREAPTVSPCPGASQTLGPSSDVFRVPPNGPCHVSSFSFLWGAAPAGSGADGGRNQTTSAIDRWGHTFDCRVELSWSCLLLICARWIDRRLCVGYAYTFTCTAKASKPLSPLSFHRP
jgi:hypothetical protein